MHKQTGSNIQDIKLQNRILILKLIATNLGMSRVDLARLTGLSKMTVGNIVTKLIANGLVEEKEVQDEQSTYINYGRKPIKLMITSNSPCICGILIKRGLCQIVLGNLDGSIFEQIDYKYSQLENSQELIDKLSDAFFTLSKRTTRRIAAVGISSIGPLNASTGIMLNPPFFYGIKNLPITSIISEITSLPSYLVNDANAGALAEKLYGSGKSISNLIYLHIMNGIGSGLILHHKLYNGDTGQSGEIGHTSINFSGPKCECGNTGCLDIYANLEVMKNRINELSSFYKNSGLTNFSNISWLNIVNAGNNGDPLAITVLDEFCSYISYSLVDTLNLLDISNIIIGYDSTSNGTLIENLLQCKVSKAILSSKYRNISVTHSTFCGNGPLVGSIALMADKFFTLDLLLDEMDVQN